ncbi:hypothetical protein M011DRAFT_133965 [Sporormia fimetaria CBS 119925]|uniref:Peptide N-acetyl-beta-D-glucosaminyl asparaginase amidase A N-terminal domain-containing protein n=1 Tax=Sporormia fimetaria CBS 119925 TaxID=1340428 RepID=A0A6A6V6R9_9PLEO|nr:hypothetical protein M011DRAFT_133965 [Sporormia fimetaria CBS 119925]
MGLVGKQDFYGLASATRTLHLASCLLVLTTLPTLSLAHLSSIPDLVDGSLAADSNSSVGLLECLQVSPPILSPEEPSCQVTLMKHTFGWSYGKPFQGDYTPPDCNFNRVIFNFTVTSSRRQFDRLAFMFLNDTEVFRTSTAEPTKNGIIWTYTKDMSQYLPLFKQPQTITFDLGNLVDDTYTGSWNTTLTATFFEAEHDIEPADMILPISTKAPENNSPTAFRLPGQKALGALSLPRNIRKAFVSIAACGQAEEEFWWSNVLSSDTGFFGDDVILNGFSPFREIQLFIDDLLAGVAWPFPVIFTGGIVPGLWRPVVGIDAFDLKEDEIDITPFVPLLSDGEEHTFEIRVVGIHDDGKKTRNLTTKIGSNWAVTGKVFLWLNEDGTTTSGSLPTISAPEPVLDLQSLAFRGPNSTTDTLTYNVYVTRDLIIRSTIETPDGAEPVVWQQQKRYTNEGELTNRGNNQTTKQHTFGFDDSSTGYRRDFDYPLYVNSAFQSHGPRNFSITAEMSRGKIIDQIGGLVSPSALRAFPETGRHFIGTSSSDHQNGTATYFSSLDLPHSVASGSTEQWYSLNGLGNVGASTVLQNPLPALKLAQEEQGISPELYSRRVLAVNDSLVVDEEVVAGVEAQMRRSGGFADSGSERGVFAKEADVRGMLGRGP